MEKLISKKEDGLRADFIYWLDSTARDANPEEEREKTDPLCKYYVYALCEKNEDNGSLTPFYIGKGTDDRVWAHEDGQEKEIEEIEKKYSDSDEEKRKRLDEMSAKYKKIGEIKANGKTVEKIIVKIGLTEYEAFMFESALINIFRMGNLKFDSTLESNAGELTNIVNGHADAFEKLANIETKARSTTEFSEFCKKPLVLDKPEEKYMNILKENKGKKILLQNINKTYPKCKNKMNIREAVSGLWAGINYEPDYVFALYQSRIVGVYKTIKKGSKTAIPVYDFDKDLFPKSEELKFRKNDYAYAQAIHEGLKEQLIRSDGDVQLTDKAQEKPYSLLPDEVKDAVRKDATKGKETTVLNKALSEKIMSILAKPLRIEKMSLKKLNKQDEDDLKNAINSIGIDFGRVKQKDTIKEIFEKLRSITDKETIVKTVEEPYSNLPEESQKIYREWFYNNELSNWIKRKYFILEDLDDGDNSLNSLVGCLLCINDNKTKLTSLDSYSNMSGMSILIKIGEDGTVKLPR